MAKKQPRMAKKFARTMLISWLTMASAMAGQNEPMAIFQPYAGTWSCTERIDGQPDRISVFRFMLDATILRETITVPPSDQLSKGDVTNATFAYDAKNQRYVETEMGGNGVWYVSAAQAPTDGTFHWTDVAAATTLGRWDLGLPQHERFTIQAYDKVTDVAPSYRATCARHTTPRGSHDR